MSKNKEKFNSLMLILSKEAAIYAIAIFLGLLFLLVFKQSPTESPKSPPTVSQ